MGAGKRAQKDRGYITATEWKTEWGGKKSAASLPFKRLPFFCCAIAFTPFEEPVCTEDGFVMDLVNAGKSKLKSIRCHANLPL
jgi:peptidyl-prolyl cis-trans isomerase-like protein 2